MRGGRKCAGKSVAGGCEKDGEGKVRWGRGERGGSRDGSSERATRLDRNRQVQIPREARNARGEIRYQSVQITLFFRLRGSARLEEEEGKT